MIITVTNSYVIKNSTVTGIIEVYLLTGDGCNSIKHGYLAERCAADLCGPCPCKVIFCRKVGIPSRRVLGVASLDIHTRWWY